MADKLHLASPGFEPIRLFGTPYSHRYYFLFGNTILDRRLDHRKDDTVRKKNGRATKITGSMLLVTRTTQQTADHYGCIEQKDARSSITICVLEHYTRRFLSRLFVDSGLGAKRAQWGRNAYQKFKVKIQRSVIKCFRCLNLIIRLTIELIRCNFLYTDVMPSMMMMNFFYNIYLMRMGKLPLITDNFRNTIGIYRFMQQSCSEFDETGCRSALVCNQISLRLPEIWPYKVQTNGLATEILANPDLRRTHQKRLLFHLFVQVGEQIWMNAAEEPQIRPSAEHGKTKLAHQSAEHSTRFAFYLDPDWTDFDQYSHLHTNLVLKEDSFNPVVYLVYDGPSHKREFQLNSVEFLDKSKFVREREYLQAAVEIRNSTF
ncbi:hypothetical protein CLF_108594 [Clonorchis sinensis]|uniref:Uncharacterized protein n=1 Tax=Clonorchis sinensis TaxID=79923 RepID=G7YI87_CLOSI|nr:hypothetical protein CLF_108594 [Clonorchis sinensis]